MLLSDYLNLGDISDETGVFDPIIDQDSHFFINLQRLKMTDVPEFSGSYDKFRSYFAKIIKLLDKAKGKTKFDIFYKQALNMFAFSEVNGICLGYAKGLSGSGFGGILGAQVMSTAYDIVKAGVTDPEFFELLPLFQENIGADRLSDMIATLILDDIKAYTKRINNQLCITPENYPEQEFVNSFLVNPYKHDILLLVPIDILHKLPVSESWEDIDVAASENEAIRAEINYEVASEWKKYSARQKKSYIRRTIFSNSEVSKRVIEKYKEEELTELNPIDNLEYLLENFLKQINSADLICSEGHEAVNSYIGAMDILEIFKQWVENNRGWDTIQNFNSRLREKMVQRVIHLTGLSYTKANNLDMNCEPDEGRGPVDFKISKGNDKTIVEVKLSTNSQYLHGYEVQIEEYAKAEGTYNMIYVLVDLGNPVRVQKLQDLHDRKGDEGARTPTLLIIDATKRDSASIT